jgi:hypothetical protein
MALVAWVFGDAGRAPREPEVAGPGESLAVLTVTAGEAISTANDFLPGTPGLGWFRGCDITLRPGQMLIGTAWATEHKL